MVVCEQGLARRPEVGEGIEGPPTGPQAWTLPQGRASPHSQPPGRYVQPERAHRGGQGRQQWLCSPTSPALNPRRARHASALELAEARCGVRGGWGEEEEEKD